MLIKRGGMGASILSDRRFACRRAHGRGFTLTELMAVVVIVAILAALALVGFRKYVNAAHGSEAVHIIGAIKAAEESYRAETLAYLDVSTSLTTYYPTSSPDDKKRAWGGTGDHVDRWRTLNVNPDGAVMYGYAVRAGGPANGVPDSEIESAFAPKPTFPQPVEPWYLVQAKGDVNANGVYSYYLGMSFTSEIFSANEGE